jgi:ATP-dependent Zn protease
MSSADIEFGPIHPHILTSMETISQTTYSQFIEQVKANQVLSANLIGDRLTYKLKNEFGGDSCQTTITDRSINLPQVLRDNNVQFTTDNTESIAGSLISLALTAGLMFGSWLFLNKYSEGGGAGPAIGVNKSKPRTYNQGKNGLGKTGVSFEDVAGVDEAKRELQEEDSQGCVAGGTSRNRENAVGKGGCGGSGCSVFEYVGVGVCGGLRGGWCLTGSGFV